MFCLQQDPLDNKAFRPLDFENSGIWSGTEHLGINVIIKLSVVVLDRSGVINIFDRKHKAGKGWRWETGSCFPKGGDYKEELQALDEEHKLEQT